jgi:hypothetical protein
MSIKTKKERSVGTDIESLIEKIILERQPHWVKRALDAEAIATTLRAELAEYKQGIEPDGTGRHASYVVAKNKYKAAMADNEQLRAERDTLARRVAELEVLVKCPREEDHLRIDELTALLRICKLTIENARSILEDIDDIDEDDDANVQDILDRVDAALAADTQPVAGVESNRGTVEADGHNVFCTFRDDGECICGAAPSEAAESEAEADIAAQVAAKLAEPDFQKKLGEAVERVKETQRQLDQARRIDPLDLLRPYGATAPADTARITKEPK